MISEISPLCPGMPNNNSQKSIQHFIPAFIARIFVIISLIYDLGRWHIENFNLGKIIVKSSLVCGCFLLCFLET